MSEPRPFNLFRRHYTTTAELFSDAITQAAHDHCTYSLALENQPLILVTGSTPLLPLLRDSQRSYCGYLTATVIGPHPAIALSLAEIRHDTRLARRLRRQAANDLHRPGSELLYKAWLVQRTQLPPFAESSAERNRFWDEQARQSTEAWPARGRLPEAGQSIPTDEVIPAVNFAVSFARRMQRELMRGQPFNDIAAVVNTHSYFVPLNRLQHRLALKILLETWAYADALRSWLRLVLPAPQSVLERALLPDVFLDRGRDI